MSLNKSLTAPCKGCEKRVLMCHDSCNKYKEFKSNMQAVSDAREDYKRQKNLCFESMVRSKFRNM